MLVAEELPTRIASTATAFGQCLLIFNIVNIVRRLLRSMSNVRANAHTSMTKPSLGLESNKLDQQSIAGVSKSISAFRRSFLFPPKRDADSGRSTMSGNVAGTKVETSQYSAAGFHP